MADDTVKHLRALLVYAIQNSEDGAGKCEFCGCVHFGSGWRYHAEYARDCPAVLAVGADWDPRDDWRREDFRLPVHGGPGMGSATVIIFVDNDNGPPSASSVDGGTPHDDKGGSDV